MQRTRISGGVYVRVQLSVGAEGRVVVVCMSRHAIWWASRRSVELARGVSWAGQGKQAAVVHLDGCTMRTNLV